MNMLHKKCGRISLEMADQEKSFNRNQRANASGRHEIAATQPLHSADTIKRFGS
jgi:hypothetical protein